MGGFAVPLSPEAAARALHEVETTQNRSSTLRRYQDGAPHLLLWAALWTVGYGLTFFAPAHVTAIWAVVVGVGLAAGIALLFRTKGAARAWRYLAAFGVLAVFSIAAVVVLHPTHDRQVGAFVPLVVAMAYALAGLWWGSRFIIAGIVLAALTLLGYFMMREYFPLWMALVGGGTLLLSGLWLRRA
jgi:hypothetical protein